MKNSSDPFLRCEPLPAAVGAALAALRRRVRRYVWREGLAAAVAWLGAAFWATLAIDWFFEPPVVVRGIVVVVIGAVLVGVLWQRIGRRAFVRMTDANMATLLERRFRRFDDSLLTVVTLNNRGESDCDPAMLAQTRREAVARLGEVQLDDVFNPQPLRQVMMAAGFLALSVALFAALSPESLGVWARRNLKFSDELWPRKTRLTVEGFVGGVRKVARGSDVEIVARADLSKPQVPRSVEVRYRTEGGARSRGVMDRRGIAQPRVDAYQEYAYTFRSVLADIHFDLVGGDDCVRGLVIQAVDSPKVAEMTLECESPSYIGRPPAMLPVIGVMQIPQGTTITIHGVSNKNLQRVQVDSTVDGQSGPSGAATISGGGENGSDPCRFRYGLGALMKDTTLLFTLTDADGIKGRDPFRLALSPLADQPPRLTARLDGIGAAVTSNARLPVVGEVSDDYGIDRIWFEYAVDQQKPQTQAVAVPTGRPTDVSLTDAAVEIRGLGVSPGQKMLLCVKAADLCDLSGGPNVGAGERWLLDVVAPEQLRAMLESRELVLRQRFGRILQEMTEIRDLLARLEFDPPGDAKPPTAIQSEETDGASKAGDESGEEAGADSPERRSSLRLMRVQGAITNGRKTAQEVVGVADAIDDIRKQLINNRIDTEELKARLQSGIAEPLRAMVVEMFPELDRRLEKLQSALDDAQAGPALRDQAQQQADNILLAMRKVLDRMIALEDFNEVVETLRGIIKAEEQLQKEVQQRHKQKIRELLKE